MDEYIPKNLDQIALIPSLLEYHVFGWLGLTSLSSSPLQNFLWRLILRKEKERKGILCGSNEERYIQ